MNDIRAWMVRDLTYLFDFLGGMQATEALRITGIELMKLNVVDEVIKVHKTNHP